MFGMNLEELFLYLLPAILLSLTLHEFFHGLVSHWLGDPTPKEEGRLSLNPLRHLDPVGTLCLLVFQFGWAKPVQVQPGYYQNPKTGMALTAFAGPFANFLLAFAALIVRAGIQSFYQESFDFVGDVALYIYYLSYYVSIISLGLGVFNLIPFPPLDGSKIIAAILPDRLYFTLIQYERFGAIILMGLLVSGVLDTPLFLVRDFVYNGLWTFAKLCFGI